MDPTIAEQDRARARAMLRDYLARLHAEDGAAPEKPRPRRFRLPADAYGDDPAKRPGPQPENGDALVRAHEPAAEAVAKLAEAVERVRRECWALATVVSELDQRVERLEGLANGAVAPGNPQPQTTPENGAGEPGRGWG